VTDDERAELETLRAEARLFNDALYADVRDRQLLEAALRHLLAYHLDLANQCADCGYLDNEHGAEVVAARALLGLPTPLSSPAQSPPPQTPPTPPAD
jgi:hypothetical protein